MSQGDFGFMAFPGPYRTLVSKGDDFGGSWLLISGVIIRVITHIKGLRTLLIATHEPPSRVP